MNYNQWLVKVDSLVCAALGVNIHDLEDYTWHDWYSDGVSPEDTASEFISDWNYDHGLIPVCPEPIVYPINFQAHLVIRQALDQFPEVWNYDPFGLITSNVKYGIADYWDHSNNVHAFYDPDSLVWIVSSIRKVSHEHYSVWSWDSIDRTWKHKEWNLS